MHLGQVLHQLVPVGGDITTGGEDAGEHRAGDVVHPVLETLAYHLVKIMVMLLVRMLTLTVMLVLLKPLAHHLEWFTCWPN